jgi:hypothetical protein
MTDDDGLDEILASLEQIIADLRRYGRDRDGIGDRLLTIKQAADVWQCCGEKIRKNCEEGAAANEPLGFKAGPVWMIFMTRLLDRIERVDGKDARKAAKIRAQKYK